MNVCPSGPATTTLGTIKTRADGRSRGRGFVTGVRVEEIIVGTLGTRPTVPRNDNLSPRPSPFLSVDKYNVHTSTET